MSSRRFAEGNLSEVTCQRSLVGANFASGSADFNWSVGAPNVFVPNESYFVIDATLTFNGKQPYVTDQLALSYDFGSTLFNNVYMKAGSQDISSCVNFLPQSSVVKNRLSKTAAWRSSVGKSAYLLESSFDERVKITALDGTEDFTTTQSIRVADGVGAATCATGDGLALPGFTTLSGINTLFNNLNIQTDYLIIAGVPFKIAQIIDNTNAILFANPKLEGLVIQATQNFQAYRQEVQDESLGNNRVYIVWKPPVGFFDLAEPFGAGDYKISLNPDSNYKLAGVESKFAYGIGTGANQYDLVINDMKLYIATYKHSLPKAIHNIGMREILVQSKTMSGGTESFQFTVPPSATGIGFFIQANAAGSNILYSPTSLTTANNEQNTLSSFQITYANTTKPNTRWSGTIATTGAYPNQLSSNTIQQRYHDTYSESGLLMNEGGAESLKQYIESGQLVYYNFVRDSENRSTQVQFSITSSSVGFTVPTKLYLYCLYNRQIEIVHDNGLIVSVRSLSV